MRMELRNGDCLDSDYIIPQPFDPRTDDDKRQAETEREREKELVCVCVCVH